MKWLVTVEQCLDEEALDQVLHAAGAHVVENQGAVPLGDQEKTWQVEGPPNLKAKLESFEAVTGVFPSSEMTLY